MSSHTKCLLYRVSLLSIVTFLLLFLLRLDRGLRRSLIFQTSARHQVLFHQSLAQSGLILKLSAWKNMIVSRFFSWIVLVSLKLRPLVGMTCCRRLHSTQLVTYFLWVTAVGESFFLKGSRMNKVEQILIIWQNFKPKQKASMFCTLRTCLSVYRV